MDHSIRKVSSALVVLIYLTGEYKSRSQLWHKSVICLNDDVPTEHYSREKQGTGASGAFVYVRYQPG